MCSVVCTSFTVTDPGTAASTQRSHVNIAFDDIDKEAAHETNDGVTGNDDSSPGSTKAVFVAVIEDINQNTCADGPKRGESSVQTTAANDKYGMHYAVGDVPPPHLTFLFGLQVLKLISFINIST